MSKLLKSNRFDSVALVLGKNVQETAQGFLKIPAYTARTGIQKYRMDDGKILKEYRPESEVFSKTSIESLATAAVTNGHPTEMVNPDNAKDLMVGFPVGGVEKKEDGAEKFLSTDLIITHRSAIDAIRAGKAELSNGYHVDLDFTDGEYQGERYDAVQRNIVNNHIAIVWKARGGDKVRLRLDSEDAILINDEDDINELGVKTMKLKIGEKEFEVSEEAGVAIKDEMTRLEKSKVESETVLTETKGKLDEATASLEAVKTEKTGLVAKVDSLESDLAKKPAAEVSKEKLDAMVKERIAVIDSAKMILSKEEIEKLDSMENMEIKKAVIKADSPKVDEEKLKEESYVNARYDHIVENLGEVEKSKEALGKKVSEGRENKDEDGETYVSPEEKRRINMEKDRNDSLVGAGRSKE